MKQEASALKTYADQRNAQYTNSASLYLDLKDRFNLCLQSLPPHTQSWFLSKLSAAIKTWQKSYPTVKTFKDLPLCTAQSVYLGQLLVDGTMQRQLDLDWVISIVENFCATQAMPVQVYPVNDEFISATGDKVKPSYLHPDGLYASWDGQHTAVAFWVIATMALGLDPNKVKVPVVVYDVKTKAEIRDNFVKNNTKEGKKLLEPIDVVQQQIYGVRIDGNRNPAWVAVELKQQYLEAAGLFLTAKKFKDIGQVGAISRPDDIMTEKISPEVVRQFSVYAKRILELTPRHINTTEAPIILGFCKMAVSNNIKYSDSDLRSLADLCVNLFGADYEADGQFWTKAERAYLNWWNTIYGSGNLAAGPSRARFNKDWSNGGTFLLYQLKKSWVDSTGKPMPVPRSNIQTAFVPALSDLF